jgi:hypothetical protein
MIRNKTHGSANSRIRFVTRGTVLVSALAVTAPTWAQPSPTNKAASSAVFADAKSLMAAGHINEACPKFAEAQRLYPTAGTLLNLGDCFEHSKPPRTASAWGAFKQAEVLARTNGDAGRQEEASQRALALEPVLSKVTIVVPPAARAKGLDVKWDGQSFGEGLWGTAIPVDEGPHLLEAGAPGRTNWTGNVLVRGNAGTVPVEIPALADAPPGAASVADNAPLPYWNTQRSVAVGLGAVGLVGIVVGSIFGIKAANKNAESLPHCLPDNAKRCDAQGVALGDDALAAAKVSTISFVIGGAALVGGTIVFLTASSSTPKSKSGLRRIEARPSVGVGVGGLTLRGEW